MYWASVCKDKQAVWELLEKYKEAYKKDDCYRWAVILKGSLECIGQIYVNTINGTHHFCEIECCVGSNFQKKGYATEALCAVTNFCFKRVSFNRVQVGCMEINHASRRLIEKCGFHHEGTLREYYFREEKYVGRMYFSMLRHEWESGRLPVELL